MKIKKAESKKIKKAHGRTDAEEEEEEERV